MVLKRGIISPPMAPEFPFIDGAGNPIPNAAYNVESFLRLQDLYFRQEWPVATVNGVQLLTAADNSYLSRRAALERWLLNKKANPKAG